MNDFYLLGVRSFIPENNYMYKAVSYSHVGLYYNYFNKEYDSNISRLDSFRYKYSCPVITSGHTLNSFQQFSSFKSFSIETSFSLINLQFPFSLLETNLFTFIINDVNNYKIEFKDTNSTVINGTFDTPINLTTDYVNAILNFSLDKGFQLYINYSKVAEKEFKIDNYVHSSYYDQTLYFRLVIPSVTVLNYYYLAAYYGWFEPENITAEKELDRYQNYLLYLDPKTKQQSNLFVPLSFIVNDSSKLLASPFYSSSNTVDIKGKVTQFDKPLKHNSTVFINSLSNLSIKYRYVLTDKEGNYEFKGLPYSKQYVLTAVDNSNKYNTVSTIVSL